jgi:hypothetical protein
MLRRHDTHNDVRIFERGGEIVACGDGFGDRSAGEKSFIHMLARDRFADVEFVRPEADAVATFASEDDGEAGTPSASADDGDLAHLFALMIAAHGETGLGTGEQAANVFVVTDDNERGGGGD